MKPKVNTFRNSMLLLFTATIWGIAFVAQSVGGETMGPFSFNGLRFIIGCIVHLPVIYFIDKVTAGEKKPKTKENTTTLWLGGILCGIVIFCATYFQQVGMLYTTVGKAGFLTSCYILLVPIFSIFLGKRCANKIWLCVALALFGLYKLCLAGQDNFSFNFGDILELIAAIFFTFHILVIDYFSPKVDGVRMSCIQFLTCGLLSIIPMMCLERPTIASIQSALIPLLYTGILSSGVAYTLQIIGQKGLNPTVACLIMSLESVISVIAGWLILNQGMSNTELLGCFILFLDRKSVV